MSTRINPLFALPLLLLNGCELLALEDQPAPGDFEIHMIRDFSPAEWGLGFFYQASEQTGLRVTSLEEVKNLLRTLRVQGTQVEAAWFKEPQSSCCTPDGIAMTAVVPMQLVLRLSSPADPTALRDFEQADNLTLSCPYFIQKLTPLER